MVVRSLENNVLYVEVLWNIGKDVLPVLYVVILDVIKIMEFTYLRQPPKRYTFEMPLVRRWVIMNCKGRVLNLFAGKVRLDEVAETRVDLNPEMPADYHMDAYDFVILAEEEKWKYDTVILDPPYNLRKSREKYAGVYTSELRKIKTELPRIVNIGGYVISFGYDTTGMGKTRGFELLHICIINHSGDHNDTLAIIERKIQNNLL